MRLGVTLISLAGLAAPAFAGGNQGAGAAPAENAPESQVDHAIAADPAAGRALFGETALTPRAGVLTFTLRQAAAPAGEAGFGYGVTDRIELGASLAWLLDVADQRGVAPSLSVKARALSNGWGAIAVAGGVVHAPGEAGVSDPGFAPYATVLGTACASPRDCVVMVSGWVGAVRGPHDQAVDGGGAIVLGEDHLRGFVELDAGAGDTALSGGVRLVWAKSAIELAVVRLGEAATSNSSAEVEHTIVLGLTLR